MPQPLDRVMPSPRMLQAVDAGGRSREEVLPGIRNPLQSRGRRQPAPRRRRRRRSGPSASPSRRSAVSPEGIERRIEQRRIDPAVPSMNARDPGRASRTVFGCAATARRPDLHAERSSALSGTPPRWSSTKRDLGMPCRGPRGQRQLPPSHDQIERRDPPRRGGETCVHVVAASQPLVGVDVHEVAHTDEGVPERGGNARQLCVDVAGEIEPSDDTRDRSARRRARAAAGSRRAVRRLHHDGAGHPGLREHRREVDVPKSRSMPASSQGRSSPAGRSPGPRGARGRRSRRSREVPLPSAAARPDALVVALHEPEAGALGAHMRAAAQGGRILRVDDRMRHSSTSMPSPGSSPSTIPPSANSWSTSGRSGNGEVLHLGGEVVRHRRRRRARAGCSCRSTGLTGRSRAWATAATRR